MPDLERKLPNWIDAFLHYTDETEPPYLYRKWTAISCIAAAMQRKCYVDWGTALRFYPNMYIVLVGPSATRKGTAMSAGSDVLQEIPNIKLAAQSTSLQALIRRLKNTNLTDVDLKTGKQVHHSSMTVFSKEFTVFLGYHNRELIAALCDWYDCERRWTYETISRDEETVAGVWVNLFAATTPDSIRSSLPPESIGAGLTSRIIFVCEDTVGKIVTDPKSRQKQEIEDKLKQFLVYDLEQISLLSGEYEYTKNFTELWRNWTINAELNPPFFDSRFDGYMGRRRTHLMKLAMIMSAARGQRDMVLTQDDLEDAINSLHEVEVKMEHVFKGVGKSDIADIIHKVTNFLVNHRKEVLPVYELGRAFSDDLDRALMERVLSTLEMQRVIKVHKSPGNLDIQVLQTRKKIVQNLNKLEPPTDPDDAPDSTP